MARPTVRRAGRPHSFALCRLLPAFDGPRAMCKQTMRRMAGVWFGAVLGAAAVAGSCAGPSEANREKPTSPTAVQGEPAGAGLAPPATFAACDPEGPRVFEPAEGTLVSGIVTIEAQLLEDPCFIAASTFVSVFDEDGTVVQLGCDNGLPAQVRWNTLTVKNGRYTIRAQRGCRCDTACPEFGEAVHVFVRN